MGKQRRTILQWTASAKGHLAKLPKKVRRGLLDKASQLRDADDPKAVHKPLTGPLEGHYRIVYSRYRLIYTVDEETLANDDVLVHVRVVFIAAGVRKERDKRDVYKVAKRLVQLGLIEIDSEGSSDQTPGPELSDSD